jgi:hypothetical protein
VTPDQPSAPHVSTGTLDSTVESYANNVILFLTSNLKSERVERERLASEAEVQIRHLRAQLARREAEMQALLLSKKQETEPSMQTRRSTSAGHAKVDLVLESQNRTLEIEIEELRRQVGLVGILRGFSIYSFRPVGRTGSETAITSGLGDRKSWQTSVSISRIPRYDTFCNSQVNTLRP